MIKKIRILLSSVFAAALCVSMLPAVALADEPSVTVNFDKLNDTQVAVSVLNTGGATERVSALQLTVGVDVKTGSLDGIDVSFAFSDSFDATIKEAMPFNRETKTLNVYVAGGDDLLAAKLNLGTLTFSANQNAEATLDVTVAGLEEGDGTDGLQMVGAARNAMGGYAVTGNGAQMAFEPKTPVPTPDPGPDPTPPQTPPITNVSPIVPKSLTETPQTGDDMLPAIIGICVVAVLAAAIAISSSRRSKKEHN